MPSCRAVIPALAPDTDLVEMVLSVLALLELRITIPSPSVETTSPVDVTETSPVPLCKTFMASKAPDTAAVEIVKSVLAVLMLTPRMP